MGIVSRRDGDARGWGRRCMVRGDANTAGLPGVADTKRANRRLALLELIAWW